MLLEYDHVMCAVKYVYLYVTYQPHVICQYASTNPLW